MKSLQIQVFGKVQGVWFRASTKKKADKLIISGTVRNMEDGSVLITAQGSDHELDQFTDWCKQGPEFAKVTNITTTEIELEKIDNFKIIRN